ncbi:hypothetical protein B6U80_01995 [Candidatus Pacearchaeota archaeon ex4484_26]|nr:MAG: hypothetical protein B6U80_01995 [Candidatus Pacearchaeota archaeon ex4484_26]
MDGYKVYTTENFDRQLAKLTKEEQKRVHKIYLQLKANPYIGDQLRYKFLREKRLKEKRIYYLTYDDLKIVLLVAVSTKKTQKETIDRIIYYLNEYREYVKELLSED